MPDEQSFIRAVIAEPDDDRPRLAYADWLEAHGREPRARLIRVQCQIEALRREEHVLLAEHHADWGRALFANGADRWVFHRGFPEEVHIEFGRFLTNHAALAAVTPLRHLTLWSGRDEQLARLADLDECSQLRSLEIGLRSKDPRSHEFGFEGVRQLALSSRLSGLRRLTLHSHGIGAAGAEIVARSPHLNRLSHLWLDDPAFNRPGEETHLAVIDAPAMSGLQELRLGDRVIGPAALRLMRDPPEFRGRT